MARKRQLRERRTSRKVDAAAVGSRSPACTAEDLGALFNLTPRRIRQMSREGIIPAPAKAGEYDRDACTRAYIRFLQERAAGKQPSKEIDERQKKLLDARVDKARLEADKLAGRLIPLDEARSVGALALRTAATHFRSLGSRMRAELAPISDPALIQRRLDDETGRILAATAADFARLGPPA